MPKKEPRSKKKLLWLLIIIWLSLPSGFGVIFNYVLANPAHIPLFIIGYIILPIVSFAAWWWVGYEGRPINPGVRNPLVDNPVYAGYKDHEND